jgi:hypothetical protein
MNIMKFKSADAWDLLYPQYLATLSEFNRDTMARAIRNSEWVWVGDVNGEIFGFWGLIPPSMLSDKAYLWFMHTDALCKHIFAFIRHSRKVTAELLRHYPILVGHGQANESRSLRWLAWCGAQFGESQGDLIPFEIRSI